MNSPDLNQKYRYWRIRTMYAMMIGYALFYVVRTNFGLAFPALIENFGYTKSDLGRLAAVGSLVYGAGKALNGFLSDRSNARVFMTIGLFGSALLSFCIGFTAEFWTLSLLWIVASWFQSMGWPPCARLLTHWYTPQELGTKWGLWNASHQIGGAVTAVGVSYLLVHHAWQTAFFIPGIISMVGSFFVYNRLRDNPKSVDLPPVEIYKNMPLNPQTLQEEDLSFTDILFKKLLPNRPLWYVCGGNFFLYAVRSSVFIWTPTFLQEAKGASVSFAGLNLAGFEIAGFAGGFMAGYLSDKLCKGRRGPVSFMYMIALCLTLTGIWLTPAGYPTIDLLLLVTIGFFVYGPQVLVGVAAADFSSKKAVGAATGLTGTAGYMGAAFGSFTVAYIADISNWSNSFLFLAASALMGSVFFALTWHNRSTLMLKPSTQESTS